MNCVKQLKYINLPPPYLTFIILIGESFSLYHSSLYDYAKPTNPLLAKRKEEGNLFVFDNVVTLDDHTHGVMRSVYSLSPKSNGFDNYPLFPACFRAAGYYTCLYDNQYFVGQGITFLTDKNLSATLFNVRNDKGYQFDGDMIRDICKSRRPSLYIVHLQGQHYTYASRYPIAFNRFKADEYDLQRYSSTQRNILAHYDNATYYNDYVVNELMNKFEKDSVCLIYFSDHGEEIYDCRDYMGHGNAAYSPNLNYQMHIPFMIWFSPSAKSAFPHLVEQVKNAQHSRISTDDISHVLLDMAGIKTEFFDKTRSFINKDYAIERHRIILNSIDYDAASE